MKPATCDNTLPLDITAVSTDVYCTAADNENSNIVGVGIDADVFDEVFVTTVLEEGMVKLMMVFVDVFIAVIVVELPLLFFKVIVLMLILWVVDLLIWLVESVIMVVMVLLLLDGKVIEEVIDDVDLVALVDIFTGNSDIISGVFIDGVIVVDIVFAVDMSGKKDVGVCKSEIIKKVSTVLRFFLINGGPGSKAKLLQSVLLHQQECFVCR